MQGGGLVAAGLHVVWALCCSAFCRLGPLVFSLPISSSDNAPTGGREAFCFYHRRCQCPVYAPSPLSLFLDAGEREKQKHFSVLSALPSPCQASGSSLWAHLRSHLGPPRGGPRGAGPCGWLGSLKGEEWEESSRRKRDPSKSGRGHSMKPVLDGTPPSLCMGGRGGLNCTGFYGGESRVYS